MDGTKQARVTPWSLMNLASPAASPCRPGGVTTRVAPLASGQKISHTETSKVYGVLRMTRSAWPSGNIDCSHCMQFPTAACGIITPFGPPVEPEVNMMYARSPGPGRRAAAPALPASSGGTPVRPATTPSASLTVRTGRSPCANVERRSSSTSSTVAPPVVSRCRRRAGGSVGSSGTKADPARSTPSSPSTRSTPRRMQTATPGPAPAAASRCARSPACAHNCR